MKRLPFLACAAVLAGLPGWSQPTAAHRTCIDPDPATGVSRAVLVDPVPLAHTALFLPVDERGELVAQGDVRRQAEHVLAALATALRKANADLGATVKLNVYLARSELAAVVSNVLAATFQGAAKPAVSWVGGRLAHPDAQVAMDAVAISRATIVDGAPPLFPGANPKLADVAVLPPAGVVYVAGLADRSDLGPATTITLGKIVSAIGHLGLQRKDIVQLKAFLQPMARVDVARRAIEDFFAGETVPPVVYVEWVSPGTPIEIEAIVAAPAGKSDRSVTYHTPPGTARSPVFSRLARIHSGRRIYISGLYGLSNPEADVAEIFRQLDALLLQAGSSRAHLAKATYYHSDPKSNARLDAFRPSYYDAATPPAASKARVPDVGQPGKGIMIDMIAATK